MNKTCTQTRLQIAVGLALDSMDHKLSILHSMGMDETAKHCNEGVYDALNLIEVAQEIISILQQHKYTTYDDCVEDFVRIGSLFRSIASAIGSRDDPLGRAAEANTHAVDIFLGMIELSEET